MSLYKLIEEVLKIYGISMESYHGGQLAGNAYHTFVKKIGNIAT
jgi:hypothetical protein